jgi:carboxypeptidase family protein/TonB-dependent receptor-like protein
MNPRLPSPLLLFAALLLTLTVRAQTFTGAVLGRVLDPQRAAIANANVTLHSIDQGFDRHTTTNPQGEYYFPLVPPGRFVVRAQANDFAASTLNVEVVVATPVRVDLILRVQEVTQQVQVLGENGVAVQTESADLGRAINPHQMSELPSLTRSPYDFMALMPGATLSNDLLGVGFAVNGSRTQSANYLLDGSENNDTFMSAPAQDVPLDSIQEFSVQTNYYDAEYGRNSGFTANIVTKTGTNQFHGSLYDYVRNSAFAANTYDNNAHGFPRPVFNRHQFGGALGGPIRHNKVYFFSSVEPIRVRSSTTETFYVPTPQLRRISAPGTQAIFQSYPPPKNLSSTDIIPKRVCPFRSTCDTQTEAGYITVPAFAFTSRVGPQDAGAGPPQNTILATGRVDWVINSKTQAFARYALENQDVFATVLQPYSSQLDVPGSGRNQNIALDLIGTWSPRLTSESRIVYSRAVGVWERFGGNYAKVIPFPAFSFQTDPAVLPFGSGAFNGLGAFYQFFQTVSWARGHHLLKFGGQFVQLRDNHTYGIGQTGDATFGDVQGFVDGVLRFYEIALNPKGRFPGQSVPPPFGAPSFTRHFRYNEPALFLEDTWKVTPRLTLTPGLRWEYFGVLHSPGTEHALDSNFYLGPGVTYLEQIARGHFLRTLDAPGDLRGRFYLPDYKNFAPRLGIAYDLFGDGKTVIRAGAGIFYDRRVGWEMFRVFLNPPSYSLAQLTDVGVTQPLLIDPYAAFPPKTPIKLSQSDAKPIATNLRSSYTSLWNATIEHEIRSRFVAGASYLGSSGSQLYSLSNVNRSGSGGLLNPSCVGTRFAADDVTPLGPDYTNCLGLNQDVSALIVRGNGSHSSYEALQLRLDSRRLTSLGAEFGVNYTWSHSLDNSSVSGNSGFLGGAVGSYLDAFKPSLDRGPSDFDVRHRFAANWIWEIPFGRNSQNWKRYLLGGWEISGILGYQTGQPLNIIDSGVPDLSNGVNTRPRLTGSPPRSGSLVPDPVSPNRFLYLPINPVYDANGRCMANTLPFACEVSVNGPFEGTLPRNFFRQPGTYYQNTAVLKNIPLSTESVKLQIRAEFYNLFNHPNLYVNSGTIDVNASSFHSSDANTIPGVTASFRDSRQIVVALKLIF